jgi:hypothetical protein
MKKLCTLVLIAFAAIHHVNGQPINFKLFDPSGGFLKIIFSKHTPEEAVYYLKNNKAVPTLEESDIIVKAREVHDSIYLDGVYTATGQAAISYTLLRKPKELEYVHYTGFEPNGELIGYGRHLNWGKGIQLVKDRELMYVEIFHNGHVVAQYGVSKLMQDRIIVFTPGSEKKQGVLSMEGETVIPVRYEFINLAENVFVAKNEYQRCAAFDINGKMLIPFDYDQIMPQAKLIVTWVSINNNDKENYGLYDKSGHMISGPLNPLIDFTTGPMPVFNEEHMVAFVDENGNMVTDFEFKEAKKFSDGMAAVANLKGEFGFIDKAGKLVVPYRYYNVVMNFENGRAKVSESKFKKAFEIDKMGNRLN